MYLCERAESASETEQGGEEGERRLTARYNIRLEFVAKTAEKMMHLEGSAALAGKDEKGKGKRGRMTEKAEDDILMKRTETEARTQSIYSLRKYTTLCTSVEYATDDVSMARLRRMI